MLHINHILPLCIMLSSQGYNDRIQLENVAINDVLPLKAARYNTIAKLTCV